MLTGIVTHHSKKNKTFVPASRMPDTIKPKTAWDSYIIGQRKYLLGTGPDECSNDAERKGWMNALNFDADTATAQYLSKHPAIEDDAEWIARGC